MLTTLIHVTIIEETHFQVMTPCRAGLICPFPVPFYIIYRFHELSEFDDTKRSCRRRLAGHNERRRKSSADYHGEGSNWESVILSINYGGGQIKRKKNCSYLITFSLYVWFLRRQLPSVLSLFCQCSIDCNVKRQMVLQIIKNYYLN